ncbi:conserved Plasmodium protein, unknown function [Plasmodium ovale wallikeri]|uniref:Uncharacterized protein n=1 Tax=Plasmodium ovale wallikeri TaxID=864142 RepID=A0A1A8Z7D3_PLAOA|nr:conserved Plasmodium protein, unknown function [Plasmodium ovale wallikeri]
MPPKMEDFLTKLKKISEQYNNLVLERKIIDKRIANIEENINKYEETKQKSLKEVELKKSQLLKNKNEHLIKCQKMEELNNKLNEILIRKQSIDNEEEKKIIKKQIDTVNNTYILLRNVQKLSDAIVKDNNRYYKTITEDIHNNGFSNKKTLNVLNCFINKSRANIQEKENEGESADERENEGENADERENADENKHNASTNNFQIIQTSDIIEKLTFLFTNNHATLTLEKQQFLFVLLMNVLKKIIHTNDKVIIHDKNKSNEVIHNFLFHNYISFQ